MSKEKIVSGLNTFHHWRIENAAYEFVGRYGEKTKAKRKIKKMGFRSWLGTLPKPALLKIQRELVRYY